MNDVPMVTMMGERSLADPSVRACVQTWTRARFAERFLVLSDGTLHDPDRLCELHPQLILIPPKEVECLVADALATRPSLRRMREKSVMFRKIVDIPLWCAKEASVLYLDTDVFLMKSIELPESSFDLVMGVDDATSYSASWRIATEQGAIPGLNAGFLYFRPSTIDLDFLDYLSSRYFLNCATAWLAEQPLWAILMSRLERSALFDGRDVRVIGGLAKRTREEILRNEFKWLKKGRICEKPEEITPLLEDCAVAHMAGCGKRWIHLCEGESRMRPEPHRLRTVACHANGPGRRWVTAGRIAMTEWIAKRSKQA